MLKYLSITFLSFLLLIGMAGLAISSQPQEIVKTTRSVWHGFKRLDFEFDGRQSHLVFPDKPLSGNPWVWRARFPEWHTEMDSILLARGFHIAYINTNDMFGSPAAMKIWDRFYKYVIAAYRLNEKVSLEGVSRGGLFIYNWAKRNPEKVNSIYAEAPVCDFKSWPGGFGSGLGSKNEWKKLKAVYGFASDDEAKAYNDQPFEHLERLAKHKIPVLHMVGLSDRVVPPEENSFALINRYIRLGGIAMIVPCTKGKQTLRGHHFPIETPEWAADFIMYFTPSALGMELN